MLGGKRPDITPGHLAGFLLGAIPVVSNLLHVFGVFTLSPDQQSALEDAAKWGVLGGGSLIAGDTVLRSFRNHAEAKVHAAGLIAQAAPPPPSADAGEAGLPSDEEEFAGGTGPDDDGVPESAEPPDAPET